MAIDMDQVLADFLNVHGAAQPKAFPGGGFTFFSKETGLPQLWHWDNGGVRQVAELPDRVLAAYHAPSGKRTIVAMDREGNEKQQFYIMDVREGQAAELVVSPDHFHNFGGWSPDETKIAFSSNRRHPGFFDVFVLDIESGEMETVFEHDGNCQPVAWTKDGRGLILDCQLTNLDREYALLSLGDKTVNTIGSAGRNASLQLLADGTGGFFVTDAGRDTQALASFTFDDLSGTKQLAHAAKWDIEELALSPDRKQIAFTVNTGGVSELRICEISSGTTKQLGGIPSGVIDSLSWMDEQTVLFGLKSAVLPGDCWRIKTDGGEAERLTFVGEFESVKGMWKESELHHFASFDGVEIPYFLYGKGGDSQPVVIYVHGGPEHQIRSEFNPVIQFLAANGFAVAAPNVRGSSGYGRKYIQMDDARKRMDAVADLQGLAEDLVATHGADASRIAVMGRSYGGFMVLAALTHYPETWAAGVDIVGISHFRSFLENTGPWRRKLREHEYGSLEHDTDFFEEIAPLNHTERITAPLLVFHGRNDTRVPVSEAEQLTADLERQGKPVELVIFEDEGHQTEKLENHIAMNERIVRFMQQHLTGSHDV